MDLGTKIFFSAFIVGLLVDYFGGSTMGSYAALFLLLALAITIFRRYFLR